MLTQWDAINISAESAARDIGEAKEEGVTLTDEQLEAVSGGCLDFLEPGSDDWGFSCPKCKSDDTTYTYNEPKPGFNYTCHKCGYKWIP